MKKRTSKGFQVVSEKGKPLSRPDLTNAQADARLKEVEMFKHMKHPHHKKKH